MTAARERPAQRRPVLIVRLELQASKRDVDIRRLRWLLKALARQHHLKCLSVGPDKGRP